MMWLHARQLFIIGLSAALLLIAAISTSAGAAPPPARPLAQATAAPTLAAPSPQQILNRSQALTYTWALIRSRTDEPRSGWDTSAYANIVFANGDTGAFVALGAWGVATGYQVLYRIHNRQVELIGPIRESRYLWGIRNGRAQAPTNIEFLTLFTDARGNPVPLLKVTGAGHAGTGLQDEGVFELLAITDGGLRWVFGGQETRIASGTLRERYRYEFLDLNEDGTAEIIRTGQVCKLQWRPPTWVEEIVNCTPVRELYRYNGSTYARSLENPGQFADCPTGPILRHR
jgi:hypothetical protein